MTSVWNYQRLKLFAKWRKLQSLLQLQTMRARNEKTMFLLAFEHFTPGSVRKVKVKVANAFFASRLLETLPSRTCRWASENSEYDIFPFIFCIKNLTWLLQKKEGVVLILKPGKIKGLSFSVIFANAQTVLIWWPTPTGFIGKWGGKCYVWSVWERNISGIDHICLFRCVSASISILLFLCANRHGGTQVGRHGGGHGGRHRHQHQHRNPIWYKRVGHGHRSWIIWHYDKPKQGLLRWYGPEVHNEDSGKSEFQRIGKALVRRTTGVVWDQAISGEKMLPRKIFESLTFRWWRRLVVSIGVVSGKPL